MLRSTLGLCMLDRSKHPRRTGLNRSPLASCLQGLTRRAKSIAEANIAWITTGADFGIRFAWEFRVALEACRTIADCRLCKWNLGQEAGEKDDDAKITRCGQR